MNRAKIFFLVVLIAFSISFCNTIADDTFSIVAVDPVTGMVGSAGASCIAGSIILSDVHPGVGVIHTQAYWNANNQNYARYLMNQGYTPQQIIDSLISKDAQNNPTIRQYGIVDLISGGRTAAYTGINCTNYKGHIIGPTYTIQGNILLGQQILDSMQARFVNNQGTLADKLMAALQGAKIVGADTRCTNRGTSSISAFIRVAKPGDTTGTYYLDLNVNNTPYGVEPIDSLQVLYNQWLLTNVNFLKNEIPSIYKLYQNYPNPFNPITKIKFSLPKSSYVNLKIFDNNGRNINNLLNENMNPGVYVIPWNAADFPSGIYFYTIEISENGTQKVFKETKKMVLVK